jgi:hypothetical protein
MYKRLRIIVPLFQVAAAIVVFVFARYCHDESTYISYCVPAQSVVTNMQYPLLIVLAPFGLPFGMVTDLLHMSRAMARAVGAIVIIPSIAFFWYYVIIEVEMRGAGRSRLRLAVPFLEMCKVIILFCAGLGAFVYVYVNERMRLVLILRATVSGAVLLLIPELVLLTWGVVLIAISIQDLTVFLRSRTK